MKKCLSCIKSLYFRWSKCIRSKIIPQFHTLSYYYSPPTHHISSPMNLTDNVLGVQMRCASKPVSVLKDMSGCTLGGAAHSSSCTFLGYSGTALHRYTERQKIQQLSLIFTD